MPPVSVTSHARNLFEAGALELGGAAGLLLLPDDGVLPVDVPPHAAARSANVTIRPAVADLRPRQPPALPRAFNFGATSSPFKARLSLRAVSGRNIPGQARARNDQQPRPCGWCVTIHPWRQHA